MRTTDDLTHGISYFNAELIRLEELLKFCKESAEGKNCKESAEGKFCKESIAGNKESLRTLIILDEILKGTNSLDKLNGSRKFLEAIAKQPVSGIIATHDLELSKMENDASGKFHNYCFEIDLGTDVTYTYKIQKGVARNHHAGKHFDFSFLSLDIYIGNCAVLNQVSQFCCYLGACCCQNLTGCGIHNILGQFVAADTVAQQQLLIEFITSYFRQIISSGIEEHRVNQAFCALYAQRLTRTDFLV